MPFGWLPVIWPSLLAVSSQTSSVLNVVEPIWTKIVCPAVQPLPFTVSPRPGEPVDTDSVTVGVASVTFGLGTKGPRAQASPGAPAAIAAATANAAAAKIVAVAIARDLRTNRCLPGMNLANLGLRLPFSVISPKALGRPGPTVV